MERNRKTVFPRKLELAIITGLLLILWATPAWAQTFVYRLDPAPVMTVSGNVPIGGFPTAYVVPNATIKLCTDSACATPATAYTDATGNTPCASLTPVTLPGTNVCRATAGPQGQFGFWVQPGTYYYTVTTVTGTFGPYPISSPTVGTLGGPGTVSVNSAGGFSVITSVQDCSHFPGADAGAKIAACVAALPSSGGTIDARGFQGAQVSSSNPFNGTSKQIKLLLGATTITISTAWTCPNNLTIEGLGDVSILQGSGAIAAVLNCANATGVTLRKLQVDGGTAAPGVLLNNSVGGSSCINRIYETRIVHTATYGINLDNCGDSVIQDSVITSTTSGISIRWHDTGGNLNMTRVSSINVGDNTDIAFQTAVLEDCSLRSITIGDSSQQLRSIGGYYYNANGGSVFTVTSGKELVQADFVGTRFEITDSLATTGTYAIDGKFVTGVFLTNPRFGNAANATGTHVFGTNFGSAGGQSAMLVIHGGTVATDVSNIPSFNPSNVVQNIYGFIAGAGTIDYYYSFGPNSNDGSVTVLVTTTSGQIAEVVRGASGQTADLTDWQKNDGTVYAKVNAVGQLTVPFVTVNAAVNDEAPLRVASNMNGTYPTAGATTAAIGSNFSGGGAEFNLWNAATAATTSFNFSQLTGVGTRKSILDLLPTGNAQLFGEFVANSIRGGNLTYVNRPASPQEGMTLIITDCTVTTGNVTTGGGTHHNIVVYNGSNWVVLFNLS